MQSRPFRAPFNPRTELQRGEAHREQRRTEFGTSDIANTPNLNHWQTRGGLVGRGILLDYRAYAQQTGITSRLFRTTQSLTGPQDIAKYQGTEIRHADIYRATGSQKALAR